MKIKGNIDNTLLKVSNPPFVGVLWLHAVWSCMFGLYPVIYGGHNGEYLWMEATEITGFQLPKYCLAAAFLFIAPLLNAHIYGSSISFKLKFRLHHVTMVAYLVVLAVTMMISMEKASIGAAFPLTFAIDGIMIPIAFITHWGFCFYIEHCELKKKERKLRKC